MSSVGYGDIHAHTDVEVLTQTIPYFSTCLHVFAHFVDISLHTARMHTDTITIIHCTKIM